MEVTLTVRFIYLNQILQRRWWHHRPVLYQKKWRVFRSVSILIVSLSKLIRGGGSIVTNKAHIFKSPNSMSTNWSSLITRRALYAHAERRLTFHIPKTEFITNWAISTSISLRTINALSFDNDWRSLSQMMMMMMTILLHSLRWIRQLLRHHVFYQARKRTADHREEYLEVPCIHHRSPNQSEINAEGK